MKKTTLVIAAVAALALLGAGGITMRALSKRAPAAVPATTQAVVELALTDVTRAATTELTQSIALTGTLRAVESALVKARVSGELQGLTVREGDSVRQGQVLGRIDPTEYQARLRQAREQADASRAQMDIARRQFDNNQALVDQGFISRTALETSQSSLASAQATHKAALATVDVALKTLDDAVLRAPIAGVIAQRLAQPGERVAVDARVLEIVDPARLELEAGVSPADSVQVRVGQRARLTVEGAAESVPATVARINPSAQTGSRSVLVYFTLAPTPGLRQGLFAQGQLATAKTQGVAVPLAALRTDKPSPYVQVVEGERIVHVPVQPGARGEGDGQTLVVVAGLAAGAVVVQGHVGTLREGVAVTVTVTRPAAAPATSASAPAAAAVRNAP